MSINWKCNMKTEYVREYVYFIYNNHLFNDGDRLFIEWGWETSKTQGLLHIDRHIQIDMRILMFFFQNTMDGATPATPQEKYIRHIFIGPWVWATLHSILFVLKKNSFPL